MIVSSPTVLVPRVPALEDEAKPTRSLPQGHRVRCRRHRSRSVKTLQSSVAMKERQGRSGWFTQAGVFADVRHHRRMFGLRTRWPPRCSEEVGHGIGCVRRNVLGSVPRQRFLPPDGEQAEAVSTIRSRTDADRRRHHEDPGGWSPVWEELLSVTGGCEQVVVPSAVSEAPAAEAEAA